MSTVRELSVGSADGARIHVEVHGREGAPAVVLAHGWTCSISFWAAQIRELAAGGHRVIAYDQRGHGRSPVHATCTTTALADDLEAVLAATLAPGERAVLAGHSMGGMTVMAAAGRPGVREHVAAVLLCNTGSSRLTAESTVVPIRAGRLRTWITGRILGSRAPLGPVTPVSRRILKYATMGPRSSPEAVEVCARIVHACPRRARYAWSRVLAELQLDDAVRELNVPAVVLAGTADRMTPPAQAPAVAAALPHCTELVELPGIGHMGPVEAAERVTAQVQALVRAYLDVAAGSSDELKEAGA
ncbi:hypothetical protein OK074_5655 [Actinobacteria bacterium OK074]|nr:hypothetical protein OK074_5655 [Actinobacteria bacterium OK074]